MSRAKKTEIPAQENVTEQSETIMENNAEAQEVKSMEAAPTDEITEELTPEELAMVNDNLMGNINKKSGKIIFQHQESNREREERIQREMIALSGMKNARDRKTILKGTIVGVETIHSGDRTAVCAAINGEENIKIYIPFQNFFASNPINPATVDLTTKEGILDYVDRQERILNKVVGYEARFYVEHINVEDDDGVVICIANRTKVLARDRQLYWIRPEHNYKVGELREAEVLYSAPHSIWITIGGYEKKIPQQTLTNKLVNDCRALYMPGDKVPVVITSIKHDPKRGLAVGLDCILAELELHKPNLAKLHVPTRSDTYVDNMEDAKKVNITTTAVITKIVAKADSEKTNARFYGWLEGYDCPCKISNLPFNVFGSPLTMGKRVGVKITGKTKGGYATVYITHEIAGTIHDKR